MIFRKEIDARYTELVRDYLLNGWDIVTKTQNGTQGEDAHIDLTKDGKLVRIYIGSCSFHGDDWWFVNGLKIVVGEVGDLKDFANGWNTIWNEKLTVISCYEYFEVDSRKGAYCFRDEYEKIHAVRKARWAWRYHVKSTFDLVRQDKARQVALRFLKKMKGYKSLKLADVGNVFVEKTSAGVSKFGVYCRGKKIRLA